ncbi:uncharacterized protein LOC141606462 isoform X2 [Silene latifolia]|uniref:uncharacterized protein LOC141606462 isoform X2 n=1 Tax=Silene latifolia TaxID=37657 RepID=UPI003D77848C
MDACSLAEKNSITLRVKFSWAAGFELAGFSLSDTISHVLDEIVKKVKEIGMLCPQPEEGLRLTLLSGPYLKRDTTLASAVKLADVNDIGPNNTITLMLLSPLLDLNGELLGIPEREDPDMFVEPSSTEEEDDEENVDNEVCPVYYKGKRGKKPKFAVRPNLGIDGDIELLDDNDQPIPVSKVWDVASIVTTASAVLLAPNDGILENLYALNRKEKRYVVLGIGIDLLSYVFLRFLRECFPDMPILAVTDLDPAHLDMIAFLDSDVGF